MADRIKIISEIKRLLIASKKQGLFIDKLVAEFMIKQGLSRRLTLECIDAVVYSEFAEYSVNKKKEKIIKKK